MSPKLAAVPLPPFSCDVGALSRCIEELKGLHLKKYIDAVEPAQQKLLGLNNMKIKNETGKLKKEIGKKFQCDCFQWARQTRCRTLCNAPFFFVHLLQEQFGGG